MATPRTVLVTGGAGFIGSHLVDRLLSEGHNVTVMDDLSTGKLRNLNPGATFHHIDINHPSMQEVFRRVQPDLVFHLAAQMSVTESTKDPVRDGQINIIGTMRILEAARRHGIEKLIYSSTGGALYGDPEVTPCDEDTPIAPLSPYGLAKYTAEKYVELYHRQHNLNYTTLRYGNVYGPRQDPHGEAGVTAIFARAMLEGRQPHIFGEGDQERDYVYVGDVVEANMCAIDRGDCQAFNIGTGVGTSVNQVFKLLQGLTGYRWEAEHRAARPGEVQKISLECSKALRRLRWSPQVTLEEGLHRTVEYFQGAVRTTA
jgi:UDP-glucose 4-epimerase